MAVYDYASGGFPTSPVTNDTLTINGTTYSYDGSAWAVTIGGVSGVDESVEHLATAGQTTFTATYTVGSLNVFLNGVKLDSTDYTATNGSTVVLDTGAALNDSVFIQSFGTFELADHYSKTASDARYEPIDSAYTKSEGDARYEPIDSAYTKAESDALYLTSTNPSITGSITEDVYSLTGTAISANNGTVQYKTLTGNTTLTESLVAGQAVTLRVVGGDVYTLTYPTTTWVGGVAPTLVGNDVIVFWKEASILYGTYVGELA